MIALRRFGGLIICLFFFQFFADAQGQTANWIFGDGYHVKYTDGEPEVLSFVPGFKAFEGASCISDTNGTLLFYSNTIQVWNANFEPLWNSDTLNDHDGSKTNGSLFLPWPGDSLDRYFAYLYLNDINDKIYVSKIDRNLDEGLGGLVDEEKNVEVWGHTVCEQLLGVKHANGRDWWILSRKGLSQSSEFALALLTPTGITNRSWQPSGFTGAYAGELTASLDGSRIALATTDQNCFPNRSVIGLLDFDRCSGTLKLLDTIYTRECFNESYGIAFSRSGNKLYYSTVDKIALYQIDTREEVLSDTLILKLSGPLFFTMHCGQLEQNSLGEILMSYRRVTSTSGTDGLANHLAVIRYPDLDGIACLVDTFGIYLNGRENSSYSLPNFANYDLGPLVGSPCDTLSPQDTTQTGLHHPPLQNISWSIYPSISSGSYTVTGGPVSWLVVHDLYGREVLRQWHEERSTFDLAGQPAGVYLVYLRAADGTQTLPRKIVRQ